MKFIRLLQEASEAKLEDIKTALKKDSITKILFSKTGSFSDIIDKEKFIATIKYHLLNNRNVLDFAATRSMPAKDGVKSHYGIKNISAGELASLRKLTASNFDESDFNQLKLFVSDLFKEHKNSLEGVISSDARKELTDWANANGRFFNLSNRTQQELKSVSSIRPDKKVVLYRGLLFKDYDLTSRKTYDGTNVEGNGLKFMKNIRDGKDIVDIEWERPSSWTTSKEIAERFAKFSAQQSSFSATMNWLSRGKDAIDGEIGFVISTLANPKDILVDMNRLRTGLGLNHGNEGEIILAPGKITARVVEKYNKKGKIEKGNTEAAKEKEDQLKEAKSIIKKIEKLKILDLIKKVPETTKFNNPNLRSNTLDSSDMDDLFHDSKTPVILKMTDDINKQYESLVKLLKEFKDKFSDVEFTTDYANVNDEASMKLLKTIKNIQKYTKETIRNSHFKEGRGSVIDLPLDKYRMSFGNPYDIAETADKIRFVNGDSVKPRIYGKNLGHWFNEYYKKLTGETISSKFEMLGEAKQKPAVEKVLKDLFDKYKIPYSDSYKENIDTFINVARRIHRNTRLLSRMNSIYESILDAEEDF